MGLGWLKSLTPRSLIGRTALILLVPIVAIQLAVSFVFIQRLYEKVTLQMTASVVPALHLVAVRVEADGVEAARPLAAALGVEVRSGALPEGDRRAWDDLSGRVVARVLRADLPGVAAVDLASDARRVAVTLATGRGPVTLAFRRDRASASNPHQLLVLMVAVSALATGISFLFLKNQVRPIRRLAEAAAAFGRGRMLPYVPSGALEVRMAGTAFLDMRQRLERMIEQRTLLLSGVSHDMRTPLTRLKLGLSMLPDDPEVSELRADVSELQAMLDTFLSYARLDATEEAAATDPVALAARLVEKARRGGGEVAFDRPGPAGRVALRPLAVERALDNLIGNALRYGRRARVSVAWGERSVQFAVEDDGPGIPEDRREEAMRPFTRLDAARNQDRGGGVGLGLSIVSDIARQHGGTLRLGASPALGGLKAELILPR